MCLRMAEGHRAQVPDGEAGGPAAAIPAAAAAEGDGPFSGGPRAMPAGAAPPAPQSALARQAADGGGAAPPGSVRDVTAGLAAGLASFMLDDGSEEGGGDGPPPPPPGQPATAPISAGGATADSAEAATGAVTAPFSGKWSATGRSGLSGSQAGLPERPADAAAGRSGWGGPLPPPDVEAGAVLPEPPPLRNGSLGSSRVRTALSRAACISPRNRFQTAQAHRLCRNRCVSAFLAVAKGSPHALAHSSLD